MLKYANRFNIKIIGVASKKDSLLLKASDIKLLLPKLKSLIQQEWFQHKYKYYFIVGDCLA